MLKSLTLLFTLFLSLNVLACWKLEGSYSVDGESWKINQKFIHDKEYAFPMGSFILRMSLKSDKNKQQLLTYIVQEKKGATLTLITEGVEKIKLNQSQDIYAKGKEGQPHSIITVKITNI
jgi:hypothetical protein